MKNTKKTRAANTNKTAAATRGGNKMTTVHEIITNRIVELLEAGTAPWQKPWTGGGMPTNLVSGKHYRGVNLFLLNMMPFESNYWLTFKQCQSLGGHVKAGSKSTPIVYWNISKRTDEDGDTEKKIPFLKYYSVFNVQQCEGLPEIAQPETVRNFNLIASCEELIHGMPNAPEIMHNEQRAYYVPSQDLVNMPKAHSFNQSEEYYSTLFHELTHSTGHETRCNRKGIIERNAFGSESYGKEELVAEMGAAILCGYARIENTTINNSAAYLQGWLGAIKGDSKLVISAAAAAQKAVDYIRNVQHEQE